MKPVTGKLTCSTPNMQNIPIRTEEGRRIRDLFNHGPALQLDYELIELDIMAREARLRKKP